MIFPDINQSQTKYLTMRPEISKIFNNNLYPTNKNYKVLAFTYKKELAIVDYELFEQ